MKERLRTLLMLLLVVTMSVAVAGCSSDDDDDENGSGTGITGTWRYSFEDGYMLITFNSGGRGLQREYDSYSGEWIDQEAFSYFYDGESGMLTILFGDDTELYEVLSVTSTALSLRYIGDDGYYELMHLTRQ